MDIVGSGFYFNQIRYMVGGAIAVIAPPCPCSCINAYI